MHLHRLLAPVALGAPPLFFALFALRNEMHLFAVGLGDTLGHYALVEAAQQLLDCLSFASFDFHRMRDWCESLVPGQSLTSGWCRIIRVSLLSPPPAVSCQLIGSLTRWSLVPRSRPKLYLPRGSRLRKSS